MNYDKVKETIYGLILGTIVCVMVSMCTSCKNTEYIPVPEYHEVLVNKTDTILKKDSIHVKDSIFTYIKGDTVFMDRWHTKYVGGIEYRNHTDTIVMNDSVSIPVYIEKKNSTLHTFTYNIGILALLALLVSVIVIMIKRFF